MADAILVETAVPFDAAEWVGARKLNKLNKDVPIEVSDACCDSRKIPADLQATFPSTTIPVTEFLALQLPDILDGHQTQTYEWFSSKPPNCDSIPTLWSSSIPVLSFIRRLENDYPQKWMNGAISVLNPLKKSIRLP
ncbi:hypothetical protein B0H14DRAFT_2574008 [Mycena olivaceomarginata]|nr:hypothetical protein B0H14DRAFT_2574008 [Mycena olivaceomarginata]